MNPYRGVQIIVEPLRLGDSVELKSGGPEMSVERIRTDGQVDCVWFDFNETDEGLHTQWIGPFRATFPPEVLKRDDDEDDE